MLRNLSPRVRRHLVGWLVVAVGLIFVATRIAAFVHIFGKHAGVIMLQTEVEKAYYDGSQKPEAAVVPRIIHQIFHNWTDPSDETMPSDWLKDRQSCIDHNDEWQNYLWTPKKSRAFLEEEYGWFLKTYDNYRFPVQRIDALRYFLLRHYGGIYMDLDNGCKAPLEPLRYYPAWVVDGAQGTLSNDILGAEPGHPFWILMTENLIRYAWNYPLPYVTISYASGQWYETEMWEKYHREKPADAPDLVRINTDFRQGAIQHVFFTHSWGGTWDNWDNHLFAWIGTHLVLFIVILAGLIAGTLLATVTLWKRFSVRSGGARRGYTEVNRLDDEEIHLRAFGSDDERE